MDGKELEKELNEMSDALEEQPPGFEEDRTEPPATETSATESPSTESPSTESPATSAPATLAPSTEAPEEDPRDAELRNLREELADLKSKVKPKTTESPATAVPSTDPPISDENFLQDLDLDDLTRDPDMFNKVLNTIYKKAVGFARGEQRKGIENLLRSIPDILKNNLALNARLKEVHDQFYEDNKDLIPWKKTVGAVFEEQMSENPDKTYEDLLPNVAKITRERLGLHKAATEQNSDDDDPPRLPRKKGAQRQTPKPDTSPLLKEIDEMDKALGLD